MKQGSKPGTLFYNTMITAIIRCIKKKNHKNERKVKQISIAHWLFFGSMIMIPILLGIVLHTVYKKAVAFPTPLH
jgi:hypothetical protein